MSYKHLTLNERYLINAYRHTKTQKEIAKIIGVHPSTISRELKRGAGTLHQKDYWPVASDQKAKAKQYQKSSKANLKLTDITIQHIKKYLKKRYSPEQVAATLRIKHGIDISHVTIYKMIEEDRLDNGTLYGYLRHRGKRRAKYSKGRKNRIPNRVSIAKRPAIVDKKERMGDWEADTIIGKGRNGAIVTAVERTSMYIKLSLPISKKADMVAHEIIRLLSPVKKMVHTITTDNGLEFAKHQELSKKLQYDHNFCDPYSSWQRELNENINGLIRQYIPKGSTFEDLTPQQIKRIENELNHRPRKSLDWKTPYEVFYENLKAS